MEAAEPATVIASQMDWTEEVPEPEERTLTVLSLYNGTVPSCETGLHAVEAPCCVMEVLETSGWFELEMEPPTLGEVEELFRELGEEMEPLDQRNRSLQLGCRIGQSPGSIWCRRQGQRQRTFALLCRLPKLKISCVVTVRAGNAS